MARRTARRKGAPKIRVPLPRQTGGRHDDKTRRPFRRRKHKGREGEDER